MSYEKYIDDNNYAHLKDFMELVSIPSILYTDLKRLTTDPGGDAHSSRSRDGEWIAYSSGMTGFKDEAALHMQNGQPHREICVVLADGSDGQY